MKVYPRILPVGERALTVEFGERVDADLVARVHALDARLTAAPPPGLIECVPTYRALLVHYDPARLSATALRAQLESLLTDLEDVTPPVGRLVELPVHYGGENGPDLEDVAQHHHLSPREVIERHTAPTYTVAMLGFAPGFAYLLGLDPRLETPRLETPRTAVPVGSVGIAGAQTGVYALSTPGGWRILGRSDQNLFAPHRAEPFALHPGDRVRFVSVP